MILRDDKEGAGPLYSFTIGDLNAWLVAGVYYLQTASDKTAIDMTAIDANRTRKVLHVDGAIQSAGYGITTAGFATIFVGAGGTITAAQGAIAVQAASNALNVVQLYNDGTITCYNSSAIKVINGGSAIMDIINAGTIRVEGTSDAAVVGGNDNDTIRNTGLIAGGLYLGGGDDRVETNLGVVVGTIAGGAGDDVYVIGGTEAILETQNGGNDTVESYADYALPGEVENLTLRGSAHLGIGNAAANVMLTTGLGGELCGRGGDDLLSGGVGDDLLRGGADNDSLYGGGGTDRLYGGAGNDRVQLGGDDGGKAYGEAGDDVLVGWTGIDLLDGGTGVDRVDYSRSTAAVTINLTTGRVSGGFAEGDKLVAIEDAIGSDFDDAITGTASANRLWGGRGADALSGADGNDMLEGGAGADVLDGAAGTDTASYATSAAGVHIELGVIVELGDADGDTLIGIENLIGTSSADKLGGDGGANRLSGLGGDDYLLGGDGNDIIDGGAGRDELHGGRGRDLFVFSDVTPGTQGGWGQDIVDDFANGIDKIDLRGVSGVHSIADLTITQGPSGALITIGADNFELWFVTPAQVDASDFLFA